MTNDELIFLKATMASAILVTAPQAVVEQLVKQGIDLSDYWDSAIVILRKWSDYTRELEEENKAMKEIMEAEGL